METITLPVYNCDGKEVDTIKLDNSVFDGTINDSVVYQAINAFRANQRKGLAATKTRGEVSGGGKKPWKQKGTGRARVGSTRSPLWRHGGVVFGPHPRDFSYELPRKIKSAALKSSLNSKVKEDALFVLDELKLKSLKTKDVVGILTNLKVDFKKVKANNVLLLVEKIDNTFTKATRNIECLKVNVATDTNVYEVLNSRKIIVTKDGLNELVKRLKK